uniref:Btz domain-containing protein n=1 Tax=Solanum tuberosum TaxID=4113 RepID=M1ATI6_SOLTU
MNIEDHKVYKKTQYTHNLVANGEESENDGEKISMSAGTEEECYGSDGYQVFAGHVDTESVGCVREDDIYEDGEIRELLMQSIAEDPMAEGMDSGKNKSYDDYVNGCDEKAEKILHKDINLRSPLLDKKETTGDDEQRPIGAGRSLSSRSGRERYSYLEEEKFHLRRNRDEIYGHGPKFARDRFQDRSFDSPRGNFMRGRGRGWGHGRYSGSHFESYGDVADYHFRHKRTAAVWESANERNDYDSRLDGGAFASNRRRNLLNDTKFTPMQRSGFPRMWSRSPVRSRTWSLPSRRLTEGLNGREDLFQQRSPVMYREDRMRSSSRTSFAEEAIAPQRCDRPSYTARRQNDMRDVDDVQEYGHPRSLSSRGSPPDQPGIVARQPSNSLLPCKKRYSLLYPHAPIHPSRNVGDLVKPTLAENLVGQEAIGTANVSSFGASVQEFNFPISSIHPSLRHKSANVLRVSLGSTLRGFNSSVLQSKSEPVEEANAGTVVRPDGTIEANLQSIELPTKELLEHHSGERRKYGERQGGPRQMRNVKEKEGGNLRWRREEEFDGFRLKKRRF